MISDHKEGFRLATSDGGVLTAGVLLLRLQYSSIDPLKPDEGLSETQQAANTANKLDTTILDAVAAEYKTALAASS